MKKLLFFSMAVLFLFSFNCYPQNFSKATSQTLFAPCPGTTTKAQIRIYRGDIDLKPCPSKTLLFNGNPLNTGGLSSLNGISVNPQLLAVGSSDTAAWSSASSTHTLNLPITSVSGSSRSGYLPYFTAANTIGKSDIRNISGTVDFFPASDFRLAADTSGKTFSVGDLTNSDTYFKLDDSAGTSQIRARNFIDLGLWESDSIAARIDFENARFNLQNVDGTIAFSLNTATGDLSYTGGQLNVATGSNNFSGATSFTDSLVANGAAIFNSNLVFERTIATSTGSQTINKNVGAVLIAAGANAVTVTNSTVNANSLLILTQQNIDATCNKFVVNSVGAGSFQIRTADGATCTGQTKVAFLVTN